jgi:hypothetical protein
LPVILAPGRVRQENHSLRPAWAKVSKALISKTNQEKSNKKFLKINLLWV